MKNRVQIEVQHFEPQIAVITLSGDVTTVAEQPIRSTYQELTSQNITKIIFNFSDNHYIDSLGIAAIIRVIGEAYHLNQQLSVSLPNVHSQKIFRLLGIDNFAPIFANLDDALEAAEACLST